MFDHLIEAALRSRSIVLLGLLALLISGVHALTVLPIDAVPDITNVQVMALTSAPALRPEEIERFITVPVENAMNGIPRVREVRSFSQFGLSGVTVVFEEGTDTYWARQQVGERLNQVRAEIPPEFGRPEMGPIATGLGEVFQFEVRDAEGHTPKRSLMELRTILDWEVARALKSVPGVVEVNAFGGELRTFEVRLHAGRLAARGVSVGRVIEALKRNNGNSGGGYIERNGQQRIIRAVGIVGGLKDIEAIVLDTTTDGAPITVRDVADVRLAPMLRHGAVTRDGQGEAVTATVLMLAGENSRVVVGRIKAELEKIRSRLPADVIVQPYYDRSALIDRTLATVISLLGEGGFLVIAVLLITLGNLRAGLIVALAIPLSMLFAVNWMPALGVAGSLMSLGAIDFGLIVDSSVIVMENCVAHLAHADRRRSAIDVIREATLEVRKPVVFGVAIITMVHLPILALEGVEGKMFRPMAVTVILALTGSLLLSLTATPVLASFFLKPGLSERETLPIRFAKRLYQPVLRSSLAHPPLVALGATAALGLTIPIAVGLGGEFIPKLDEGDIVIVITRPPDTGLTSSLADTTRLEKALLRAFPDMISSVVSKTGRPEIGIDPAGVNQTDVLIFLKHEPETLVDHLLGPFRSIASAVSGESRAKERAELIERIEAIARRELPGASFNFGQPIETRFNEMLAGVRADLGIGIYGDDLRLLQEKAAKIANEIRQIPGAADVRSQVISGLPVLRIAVDRDRIARYGVDAEDVLDVVSALGGTTVGQVVEGERRFDLQVRFSPEARESPSTIRELKVADRQGRMIPLADLTEIRSEDNAYEIWRKDRRRRAMVQANVRGRDLAGFVADAQKRVGERIELPRSWYLEWGGTFENLRSASERLTLVVPVALALIFLLLYGTFGSARLGLLIFLSVPLGAIGGVLALRARGMNFSISAGVGFIALSGVAVLDGLVMVAAIRRLVESGESPRAAVERAAPARLRPILMTALVAGLGFIPMAVSNGSGAEVQRPLATVVIGGLVSGTLLKLIVLPALYAWFDPGNPTRIEEAEPA